MYFDYRAFFRIAYLSFFKWGETKTPLTLKRMLFIIFFFVAFPLVQLFNGFCFLLDDMIFPAWRRIDIKKPVFIVGNPRSGTTFLHRLLAKDEENFFCFRTWEIIFPAIVQKKALALIGRLDQIFGNVIGKRIEHREAELFNDFSKIHRIGLFSPEEDDKLLIHNFSFHGFIWFFPFDELSRFHRFDQFIKGKDRNRIMTFYRNCIKRQAYFKDHQGHFLSKNPVHSLKIDSLYEYFPDCKIIYLARNPLDVVPSTINMAHEIWSRTSNMSEGYPMQDKVYETVKLFYQYPLQRLQKAPPHSNMTLRYEDLLRQPSQMVYTIYGHLGFNLSDEYKSILQIEQEKAQAYKSEHHYSLDNCNYTKEQIIDDLSEIFQRFNFSARN